MMTISASDGDDHDGSASASNISKGQVPSEPPTIAAISRPGASSKFEGVDKNMLVCGAPPRRSDKAHLRYVATKACLVCGREPSDPHHLRFAQPPALSRKVSDEFTVPLCRSHRRELHRARNERKWWGGYGLDPMPVAARLWNETHGIMQRSTVELSKAPPTTSRKRKSNGTEIKSAKRRSSPEVSEDAHDVTKAD